MNEPKLPNQERRRLIALLLVTVPVFIGLIIVALGHFLGSSESSKPAPRPEPTRREASEADTTGTPAPRIRLAEAGGRAFDSGELGAVPYAVVFASTGCEALGTYLGRVDGELEAGTGAVLAISAEPKADSPKAASAWLAKHHIRAAGPVHFLLGTEAELQGLWNAWGFPGPSPTCPDSVPAHLISGQGENAGVVDLDPTAPTTILTDALAGLAK
jgi:cytochrome oxidase Cu insertion factor (SCO1/SenC/PrrC family)